MGSRHRKIKLRCCVRCKSMRSVAQIVSGKKQIVVRLECAEVRETLKRNIGGPGTVLVWKYVITTQSSSICTVKSRGKANGCDEAQFTTLILLADFRCCHPATIVPDLASTHPGSSCYQPLHLLCHLSHHPLVSSISQDQRPSSILRILSAVHLLLACSLRLA